MQKNLYGKPKSIDLLQLEIKVIVVKTAQKAKVCYDSVIKK